MATGKPNQPAAFADIVCAVNGSRGSAEAARQAIALATPGSALTFVAVFDATGTGLAETAGLSEQRARKALDECAGLAQRTGVTVPPPNCVRGAPRTRYCSQKASATS